MARPTRPLLTRRHGPRIQALEARLMFDAAAASDVAAGTAVADAAHAAAAGLLADAPARDAAHDAARETSPAASPVQLPADVGTPLRDGLATGGTGTQVVFVMGNLADVPTLVQGMAPGAEVHVLDASQDGLAQMARILGGRSGIDAIHVLSHGSEGKVELGTVTLDSASLASHATQLAAIGASLKDSGDLLLYGCNVAAGTDGHDFIEQLARVTQADIAASVDRTGAAVLGANWVLEASTGSIQANALVFPAYSFVMATPADGLYTFANAVSQADHSYTTADGFFSISSFDGNSGNGGPHYVSADGFGAFISDSTTTGSNVASYLQVAVRSGGSFQVGSAVIGDFNAYTPAGANDFTNVYAVGYANNVQVAITPSHNSVGVYEANYGLNFSSFNGVAIDAFRVYYTWNAGTMQTDFNLESLTIRAASTQPPVADTTPPTVSSVSASTANGSYKVGDTVSVQVNFSEAVNVTGTPKLTLETGATDRAISYASGSGTSTLTFSYTVQAGDLSADLDVQSPGALSLNGGTIKDAAGNDATLTLAAPGAAGSLGAAKAIVIDGVAPTVGNVTSSTADGPHKVGDVVSVQVDFSEAVTVTGTPQLTLETGATDRTISYASGSGTNTLTFNYTVLAGDQSADLDVQSTSALSLNGGAIKDSVGNNAVLTLAAPGAAGSLGANKALVIDGVVPTVSSSAVSGSPATSATSLTYALNFSESISGLDASDLQLTATGTASGSIASVSGSGSSYLVTLNSVAGTGTLRLDLKSSGTGITDAAGNAIAGGYTSGSAFAVDHRAVFDANNQGFGFSTSSLISGTGTNVGTAYLYSNVITIGGHQVDAIVTLTGLTNATLDSFDSTANPYANTGYFQPNITIGTVGGFALFRFDFIDGGSYNASTNPTGTAVVLRNVLANTYDLDGSGASASGRQFTDFSGIGGYTLSSTTQVATPTDLGGGVTRFVTTVGGNVTALPGTAAGDNVRARVSFDEVSSTSVKVGDLGATGLAYFGIDFSAGTTFTNARTVDVTISGGPLTTSESGTSASFDVVLTAQPTGNVTVTLTGLNTGEGSLSASTLTFTTANWNTPQTVTVTGVDDAVIDGNVSYTLTATTTSAVDTSYNGRTAVVTVTNLDNDSLNAAPVVGGLGGDSVSFTEGGSLVLLDTGGNATVTDSDSANFSGGHLTAAIVTNGVGAEDVLSIRNEGSGAGQIGVSGSNVSFGGTVIGSFAGGSGGNDLVVTLNASATPAAVQALVHNLGYANSNTTDPSSATRTVRVTVDDGAGGTSSAADVSVSVVPVNDAPTLNATGGTPTFTEGGSAVSLFSGAAASTIESGQAIDQLSLTVSGLSDGASEKLVIDGSTVNLTHGNAATTSGSGLSVAVSVTAGTATVTVSKAGGISAAATQTLVNGLAYSNTSDAPGTAPRVITLTGVRDTGGTANGGVDSASLSRSATVTVVPVNDAPVATASGGSAVFVEGKDVASTPVVVDSGLVLSDADNATLASATVSLSGNFRSGEDLLAFSNTNATTFGNIGASYNSGTGVLTLTSSGATATVAQWQAALRAVSYTNSSDTPNSSTRTVSFVVNDGTANSSAATRTVTVTPVNDTPVVSTSGGAAAFTEGNNVVSTPVVIDGGLTVADVDNTTLASATVSVTGNFHSGEDALAFSNTSASSFGNIVSSYNAATGMLTLSSSGATATLAQWQAALRAVTYTNSSDSPSTATRTLSFAVNDGTDTSALATRAVTVTAVNDTATISVGAGDADSGAVTEDATTPNLSVGHTLSVSDADSGQAKFATTATFDAAHSSRAALGTLAITDTGSWTYTVANADVQYLGAGQSETLKYTVTSLDGTASHTVTITINGANDAPVAGHPGDADWNATDGRYAVTTPEDTPRSGTIAATDVDGDALGFSTTTAPAHGTVTLDAATGAWVYTPAANFNGNDSFVVTVDDGHGGSTPVTVAVTVTPVNDAPVAGHPGDADWNATDGRYAVTTPEDTPRGGTIAATDVDGDALGFSTTTAPAHGTVTLDAATGAWLYTPAANYNGPDSFVVTVDDGHGGSTPVTVAITVTPVNDAPVAGHPGDADWNATDGRYTVTTPEDTPRSGTIAATDVDGDALGFSTTTAPAHGTVTLDAATGTWLYTPAANYNGPDSFVVTVDDGHGGSTPVTVAITVTPVNDAPVAGHPGDADWNAADGRYAVATPEDTPRGGTIAATDVDGNVLAFSTTTGPAHGTVTLDAATGAWLYTPAANFNGNDSFVVTVDDGHGGSTPVTVAITVTPVNDAPVAGHPGDADWNATDGRYAVTTPEDTPRSGTIAATDVDGNALAFSTTTAPARGTVTLDAATGAWVYTPAANYNGPDSFVVTVDDGHGGSTPVTVAVTVTPVNDAPVAGNPANGDWSVADGRYAVTTPEDTPRSGTIAATDVDGNVLAFSTTTAPAHGTVTLDAATGAWVYTPAANYNGPDSFVVTVDDGHGGSTPVTVAVTVTPVNDAPVAGHPGDVDWNAADGRYAVSTPEDTPRSGTIAATDVDGNALAFSTTTAPAHGTVTLDAATGAWVYTPAANYNGPDSFVVTVDDGHGGSTTATVAITVTPVNDAPVAGNPANADWHAADGRYAVTTPEDTPRSGTIDAADVDGNALSFATRTGPAHGTVTLDAATGAWVYTPAPNFNGNDSFVVTVDDGHDGSTTATVAITVTPVNDAPVAGNPANADWNPADGRYAVTTPEDTPRSGTIDATDVDGNALSFATRTGPAHGTVTLDAATGAWVYTPAANYNGPDSFVVTVDDGHGGSTTATVVINVTPVNDAPTLAADALVTSQDSPWHGQLPAMQDVEGGPATYAQAQAPAHGTVTVDADGHYRYSPAAGFHGSDRFQVQVADADGATGLAWVEVTVQPAPTIGLPAAWDLGSSDHDRVTTAPVITLAGDALPGELLRLYTPAGALVREVTADAQGHWAVADIDLRGLTGDAASAAAGAPGAYTFTLRPVLANGSTGAAAPLTVVREIPVPALPTPAPFEPVAPAPALPPVAPPTPLAPALPAFDSALKTEVNAPLRAPTAPAIESGATVSDIYTRPSGFQIAVAPAPQPALKLLNGVDDQVVKPGQPMKLQVPADTFVHTQINETVTLKATQADGAPLPTWLSFDGKTGTLVGNAPAELASNLAIVIVARDSQGREATTTFRIEPSNAATPAATSAAAPAAAVEPRAPTAPAAEPAVVPVPTAPRATDAPPPEAAAAPRAPATAPGADAGRNPGDIYTRPSGFQIMVTPAAEPALKSFRGIDDQVVKLGQAMSVQVPADTFVHTQIGETVTLQATQADGRPLPGWLRFDGKAGTLVGEPPPGWDRDIAIRIVARDSQGRSATTMFRIKVGDAKGQRGAGLSHQLMRGDAWAVGSGGWQAASRPLARRG